MIRGRAVLAIFAALLLAGCGGEGDGGDESAVRDVLRTYFDGVISGDGARSCGVLTGERRRAVAAYAIEQLPEFGAATCRAAIEAISDGIGADEAQLVQEAEITVRVNGESATATVTGGTQRAEFRKVGDRWLISGGIPD